MDKTICENCVYCKRIEGKEICDDKYVCSLPTCVHGNIDNVKHPAHYADTVPGIECIQVTRWMNFCRGSAVKYLWRAGIKDKSKEIEDLRKAIEFIEFEIKRIEEENAKN
jgi:hypothetical protein